VRLARRLDSRRFIGGGTDEKTADFRFVESAVLPGTGKTAESSLTPVTLVPFAACGSAKRKNPVLVRTGFGEKC